MKRAQGGYIMVVVLLCTAAISLTGALVFTQSQDQMVTTQALRNQTIAAARANLGAQRVLAELRMAVPPSYLEGLDSLTPCESYDICVERCRTNPNCNHFRAIPVLDRGRGANSGTLADGAGSIYSVRLYREQKMVNPQTPDDRITTVIVSTGYYGFDPVAVQGSNRFESMVMVEVGGLEEAGDTCTGYCGGGLN